jgi:tellurium resistance protein TerD
MSLILTKGGSLNLSKGDKVLKKVRVGMGWKFNSDKVFDLDASAFGLFYADGRPYIVNESYVIFYNQPETPDKSIIHSGDDRVGGDGEEDNEILTVDLEKVHFKVSEISFVCTIHEAIKRSLTFGMVKCFIRLVDAETNEEVARYNLDSEFTDEVSVQFGSLYKENNEWHFKAIGAGSHQELKDYCIAYGATVS